MAQKKFVYRLQKILEFKEKKEEEEKEKLAKLMDQLEHERIMELAIEGKRWYDIKRWGLLENAAVS